jgi:preprotein translocase SecE subunit
MLTGQWAPRIPFTGGRYLPLLHDLKFTAPMALAAAGLWLAWRGVNYPTFADFLIATEAEMNKVSWTSRRRLVQDTIVVLITVLLFTVFLLAIDSFWGFAVTKLGIVPEPPTKATTDNPQELPW